MSDDHQKSDPQESGLKGVLKWIFESDPLRKERMEELRRRRETGLRQGAVQETVRDLLRDMWLAGNWLATGGDKQQANSAADSFEQWWRRAVTQNVGMGKFEFRMGAGWVLPEKTEYNGKIDQDRVGKSLPVDAVFLRHKNGKIEVLDHHDPRYYDLVVPFLVGQVVVPAAAGKAMAAVKFISAGKGALETASKVSEIGGKLTSAVNTGAGLGVGVSLGASQLIFKPEAINRMAHLLDDPSKLKPDSLRNELNKIFEQFSYLNGPFSEQFYVPQIKANENPFTRLQELSRGFVHNVFRSENPFDRIEDLSRSSKNFRAEVGISEATSEISQSPYFQRSYLKLAKREIMGEKLSDNELVLLRFGTNVYTGLASNILPEHGDSFSDRERAATREAIKGALQARMFNGRNVLDSELVQKISEKEVDLQTRIADLEKPKNPIISNRGTLGYN